MKKILFIRFIVIGLCLGMIAEISVPLQGDLISVEIDSEMEHEETNEKEKNTSNEENLLCFITEVPTNPLSFYTDPYWNSPSLEDHTPPPELS